ncbi:MAG: 6-carboxytetrahydropterin synthase [Bacteriovoracaceae bacterium]|nr:6-carboxytetrahydropterin synthase [Bacteriovoracaceae bacterium]
MDNNFSIRVYKQNFNFACSHFLFLQNGKREPLHGHNYKVAVKGENRLNSDMVFDFLDIKPIVREVCSYLDHRVLLPSKNEMIKLTEDGPNLKITTADGHYFSIPQNDTIVLPITNTSAERLAQYIAHRIEELVYKYFRYSFKFLEVEVEETPGQSATYRIDGEQK